MSDRQVFVLANPLVRRNAARACAEAPEGYRVEIKPRTRTLDQNDLMWSVLTDIANQVDFVVNGQSVRITKEEVKDILTAALVKETRMAMGIDGGTVFLGRRTSKMSIREMVALIDLAHAFGTEKDVRWSPASLGRGI